MAADFTGEVIRVLDGDSIEVFPREEARMHPTIWRRLPGEGQAFEQKAKQATSLLLFGKDVRIRGSREG